MLHQVGVGALGPVFRTYEPTRDRLVAVKVFRLDITPEQARALADELAGATQAGLFHPSIVEPIAAGVEGTVAYRAEEYVAAESLDVAMRHYAPAPVEKVLPFISQLAAAVDFARLNGVGHGALHPRDIFVTPEEARATGFGVVEALERVGLRAPVRRPYSAPERVAGDEWGTRADVFSLGAIAYELLTGRRPAGVGSAIGDLSGASATHAGELHAILVKAMAESPASRYPTAMGFATALEAASRGASPVVQPFRAETSPEAAVAAAAAAVPRRRTPPPEPPKPVPPLEPEIDDITPELEEDDAFAAFAIGEASEVNTTQPPRDLFDIESAEDLAIEPEPQRFQSDFDPESLDKPLTPERFAHAFEEELSVDRELQRTAERQTRSGFRGQVDDDDDDDGDVHGYVPPRRSIDYVPDEEYAAAEPPRRRTLPSILLLLLGIIIGVGAGIGIGYGIGYGVGSRSVSKTADAEADAPQKEAAAADASAGKPYSEQTVTPSPQKPAEPPPIPGDAPAPAAAAPAAPRSAPAAPRSAPAAPRSAPAAPRSAPAAPRSAPAAPPSAPSSAPLDTGRLIVRSVPADAGVTIDGTWRGRTPLTVDKLSLGSHEVRIIQAGYAVARQSVALTAKAPARTLSFRLERDRTAPVAPPAPSASGKAPASAEPSARKPADKPAPLPPVAPEPRVTESRGPGSLYVDSRPRGAAVFLDGRQVGVTPATISDVPPGPHVVRIELLDHRVWTANSQVLPGQQTRVTGSLERIR